MKTIKLRLSTFYEALDLRTTTPSYSHLPDIERGRSGAGKGAEFSVRLG